MQTLQQLINRLNTTDECSNIEAKKADEIGKSIMETICSFSNEPHLGGGYILLGVVKDDYFTSSYPKYKVQGIPYEKLDEIQTNLASQAASMFNRSIRPKIKVETVDGKNAIVVFIEELNAEQKPLYFKHQGLPQGAYRRIGAADQQCTEDDMALFYQNIETIDKSIITDAQMDDLSEDNIDLYRKLREKVNPMAEELTYSDNELLMALSAIKKDNDKFKISYTGLLTFGSRNALRRLLPMVRVDYIRTSDNEWVGNTKQRFVTTLDMRGALLELIPRIINTINDDLPKAFELNENDIQAKTKGLPYRVLREAVVNSLMHRSYRENSPIQIIRYPNRIEIINPGFSLKTEEKLGEPGSINRNPFIASIFHETNLAETKGSGIRFMQRLMNENGMMPPTFESDRTNNRFTIRLLLHHLLNENDLVWLKKFDNLKLKDSQKRILIFLREVGAINNAAARQINGYDINNANLDLNLLTKAKLISIKGKNRFTYYIPSPTLIKHISKLNDNETDVSTTIHLNAPPKNLSTPPNGLSAPLSNLSALPKNKIKEFNTIVKEIEQLPKRINNKEIIINIIIKLCRIKPFKISELSTILGKSDKYLLREFIRPLLNENKIVYLYPDMINHPEQAYKTIVK